MSQSDSIPTASRISEATLVRGARPGDLRLRIPRRTRRRARVTALVRRTFSL